MSEQEKKSSIRMLAAGFLGFIGVVGLGSLVIFHHGASAMKAPAAAYLPVDAGSGRPAAARAAKASLLGASASAVSSPAPLLPDEARDDDAAAASPAAASPAAVSPAAASPAATGAASVAASRASAAAPAAVKLVVGSHLDSAESASTSASAPVSAAPKPKASPADAKKPFFEPKLDVAKNEGALASTIHYGVSDRAELMGRAAGPVYNFSGRSLGAAQSGQIAADNAGQAKAAVLQQVDAAQKKIDSLGISDAEKIKIDQNLNQASQTAASAPSGQ